MYLQTLGLGSQNEICHANHGKQECQMGVDDKEIIKATLCSSPNKKERKWWRVKDALNLDSHLQVLNSPTVKSILHRWELATCALEFKFEEGTIPKKLIVDQLLTIYKKIGESMMLTCRPSAFS